MTSTPSKEQVVQEGAGLAMPVWDHVFLLHHHHLTQSPPLQALLMLEENICSMSSFPASFCLATGGWKMALCQHGVGEQEQSSGLMWALHRVLAPWQGVGSSPLYPGAGGLCGPPSLVGGLSPNLEHFHAPLWGGGQQ